MGWKSLAGMSTSLVALLGIGCQAQVDGSWEGESGAEFETKEQNVIGGTDAVKGSFPWIAQLSFKDTDGTYFHDCGGSLIAPNWVLTAAHCVIRGGVLVPNDGIQVTIGEHDLDVVAGDEQVARQGLPRTVAQIIPHPDFPSEVGNDLALIRLSTPVQLNQYAQIVRLAEGGDGPDPNAKFAGWGYAVGGDPIDYYLPDILQQSTLPVVEDGVCNQFYQDYGGGSSLYHDLTAGELCAGTPGYPSTCNADSGGPLTVKRANGCEEQVGLLNWGYLMCGSYSVYARVTHHLDWIKQNVPNLGGDTTYQAENMYHSTGGSHPDGWNIYDNGYISFNHTFTAGSQKFIITAAGKEGQGWPNMRVTVGSQQVNVAVNTPDWEEYEVTLNVPNGNAEVRIYFTNDNYQPNANPPIDRNLFIEKAVVQGKTACTGATTVNATLNVYDDWGAGYCARVQLTNTSATPTTGWNVVIDTGNANVNQSWNPPGKTGAGNHTFSSAGWNAAINPNATYNQSGFCALRAPGTTTLPTVVSATATY